jgi:hypothetical protein
MWIDELYRGLHCSVNHYTSQRAARPDICDDGVSCTVDQCNNNQCINTKETCDDADPCTIDFCDDRVRRRRERSGIVALFLPQIAAESSGLHAASG